MKSSLLIAPIAMLCASISFADSSPLGASRIDRLKAEANAVLTMSDVNVSDITQICELSTEFPNITGAIFEIVGKDKKVSTLAYSQNKSASNTQIELKILNGLTMNLNSLTASDLSALAYGLNTDTLTKGTCYKF